MYDLATEVVACRKQPTSKDRALSFASYSLNTAPKTCEKVSTFCNTHPHSAILNDIRAIIGRETQKLKIAVFIGFKELLLKFCNTKSTFCNTKSTFCNTHPHSAVLNPHSAILISTFCNTKSTFCDTNLNNSLNFINNFFHKTYKNLYIKIYKTWSVS